MQTPTVTPIRHAGPSAHAPCVLAPWSAPAVAARRAHAERRTANLLDSFVTRSVNAARAASSTAPPVL